MNDNDLNEMIKKAQSMIQNNQIPDDIKSLINNLQNSNNNNTSSNVNNTYRNNPYNYSSSNNQKNNSNYNYSNNKYNSNNNSSNSTYSNNTNFNNGIYNNTEKKYNNSNYQNSSQVSNNNEKSDLNSITSNIDMETLMKIQNIMSKMKNSDNDDMSKLLLSLKPYLRDGRKEKIDEYIQLIKMGKMTQFLDLFGGEKK